MITLGILRWLIKNGISGYEVGSSYVQSKLSNVRIKFMTLITGFISTSELSSNHSYIHFF